MFKRIVYIILFLFSLSSFAYAANSNIAKTISIVTESWENSANADGSGLYFDIVRAVFEPAGYKVVYKIFPYNRATKYVDSGYEDAVFGPYVGDLSHVIYPRNHLSSDVITAIFLKKNFLKWNGAESLRKSRFSWIRGYDYQKNFDVPIKYEEVNDIEHALKFLETKRVDYFLNNSDDFESYLLKNEKKMTNKVSDYEYVDIKTCNMFMCFVNNEKGKKLAGIWDEQMPKLIKSGKLKAMFDHWKQSKFYNFSDK